MPFSRFLLCNCCFPLFQMLISYSQTTESILSFSVNKWKWECILISDLDLYWRKLESDLQCCDTLAHGVHMDESIRLWCLLKSWRLEMYQAWRARSGGPMKDEQQSTDVLLLSRPINSVCTTSCQISFHPAVQTALLTTVGQTDSPCTCFLIY